MAEQWNAVNLYILPSSVIKYFIIIITEIFNNIL